MGKKLKPRYKRAYIVGAFLAMWAYTMFSIAWVMLGTCHP